MFGCKGKELGSRVGCLIESPGLYGNMSAYENLKIKCILFGIKEKGYIEGILQAQLRIYGYYILDELITDDILDAVNASFRKIGQTSLSLSLP